MTIHNRSLWNGKKEPHPAFSEPAFKSLSTRTGPGAAAEPAAEQWLTSRPHWATRPGPAFGKQLERLASGLAFIGLSMDGSKDTYNG